MCPLIIMSIAAEQTRERAERAERQSRVRQAMAAASAPSGARRPGGRWRRRASAAVIPLRPATPRAAGLATRSPR